MRASVCVALPARCLHRPALPAHCLHCPTLPVPCHVSRGRFAVPLFRSLALGTQRAPRLAVRASLLLPLVAFTSLVSAQNLPLPPLVSATACYFGWLCPLPCTQADWSLVMTWHARTSAVRLRRAGAVHCGEFAARLVNRGVCVWIGECGAEEVV